MRVRLYLFATYLTVEYKIELSSELEMFHSPELSIYLYLRLYIIDLQMSF